MLVKISDTRESLCDQSSRRDLPLFEEFNLVTLMHTKNEGPHRYHPLYNYRINLGCEEHPEIREIGVCRQQRDLAGSLRTGNHKAIDLSVGRLPLEL